MKTFPDNHFSAIVTDPPYGLKFMNKEWDHGVPGRSYWTACYNISRPGSFLLAFGGTRTFHRLCCEIEDAGYEIRDTIMWIYGSGFPKSHNHFGIEGYGTALKPAYEPIIMAMKPCDGTFSQNAQKWGQAGINIDGCRVGAIGATKRSEQSEYPKNEDGTEDRSQHWARTGHSQVALNKGRWPANIIFDEEAAQMLDEQSGNLKSGSISKIERGSKNKIYGKRNLANGNDYEENAGGASRFFYCAKASRSERNEGNNHPTVKPLRLMEYLIKLVMPPKDGLLLDPFTGSGTTILAAKRLGFEAIGIEMSEDYCEIARKRIDSYKEKQMEMFG